MYRQLSEHKGIYAPVRCTSAKVFFALLRMIYLTLLRQSIPRNAPCIGRTLKTQDCIGLFFGWYHCPLLQFIPA